MMQFLSKVVDFFSVDPGRLLLALGAIMAFVGLNAAYLVWVERKGAGDLNGKGFFADLPERHLANQGVRAQEIFARIAATAEQFLEFLGRVAQSGL